jgi:pyruvate-ferredoxin/flavodoxin oxidoreductase
VTAEIMAGRGDDVPVSKMPIDGSFPTGTTQWEKRNIALEIPVWDPDICIQCLKCVLACPHSVIRGAVYDATHLEGAPAAFKSCDARGKEFAGKKFTLQVSPEDCTSCGACIYTCPAKDKKVEGRKAINFEPQPPIRAQERENWEFFLTLPDLDRAQLKIGTVKGAALLRPLFEFSGACAGCGETPYVSLLARLFGDRAVIANATGCSSIYGGNLPTTPWTFNRDGRGPTWSNSLFEDCAEFGFGFRLTIDKLKEYAEELVEKLSGQIGETLAKGLLEADQTTEAGIQAQRERVAQLKTKLAGNDSSEAKQLAGVADYLVRKSVWSVGGDGWAYDIGYGGLDHVLASGRNINLLVLDSEVYSNTGGQASKATPRGAVAKFAAAGRPSAKKDLGLMAMSYGNVYVASVASGANDAQCVKAFLEAESYDGPSMIIAYSHCAMHGIDMSMGNDIQKRAVDSGHWILYRYDPRRMFAGDRPLKIDSKAPSIEYKQYAYTQIRFRTLTKSKPKLAEELLGLAQYDVNRRWQLYQQMAEVSFDPLPGMEKADTKSDEPETAEAAARGEAASGD